jgi:hypothetical protein
MSLLELFVDIDNFCQTCMPVWEKKLFADGSKKRRRAGQLSTSEITPALAAGASVTIIIYFHQSRYRNFKAYYTEHICQHLRGEFSNLVSYERFVILLKLVSLSCWGHVDRLTVYGVRKKTGVNLWKAKLCENL